MKENLADIVTSRMLKEAEKWWSKLDPFDNIQLCERYKWSNIFISNEKLIEIYKFEHLHKLNNKEK